ncbi:hypothetical protein [Vreelandella arcis]|uniref:Uncharacterized protein n=1 Tax=Vreelandella arcis TaxID=416873 RepID=A0A1H0FI93_9GAMM|nr:hypothetical protein [Halomonas arcis]SDN94252.1 hypothetical protein SAMN04487951_11022 [Halomonas arcis]
MNLRPTLSALIIAAIPMAAQAGQASELTMQLNEPLSTSSQVADQDSQAHVSVMDISREIENEGKSAAMAKARAILNAKHQHKTDIEVTGDPLQPAREATT